MLLQILDKIVSSPALLIGTLLAISFMVGATKHWLTDQSLRDRQQFDDEEFGKSFFPGDAQKADIAVRIRRILSENLEMPLDGIRPEDKLNDDLDAQLGVNLDLFWVLEEEFDIDTMVDDLDEFEKTVARVNTFSDLVEYVEAKIEERPKRRRKEKSKYEIDPDDRTSDVIAAMWFGGLITFFVSDMLGFDWLVIIGLTAAYLPFAVGPFFLCRRMVVEAIEIAKSEGWQFLRDNPWSAAFSAVVFGTILSVGAFFSWGIFGLWLLGR